MLFLYKNDTIEIDDKYIDDIPYIILDDIELDNNGERIIDLEMMSEISGIHGDEWLEFLKFLQLKPFHMSPNVSKLCDMIGYNNYQEFPREVWGLKVLEDRMTRKFDELELWKTPTLNLRRILPEDNYPHIKVMPENIDEKYRKHIWSINNTGNAGIITICIIHPDKNEWKKIFDILVTEFFRRFITQMSSYLAPNMKSDIYLGLDCISFPDCINYPGVHGRRFTAAIENYHYRSINEALYGLRLNINGIIQSADVLSEAWATPLVEEFNQNNIVYFDFDRVSLVNFATFIGSCHESSLHLPLYKNYSVDLTKWVDFIAQNETRNNVYEEIYKRFAINGKIERNLVYDDIREFMQNITELYNRFGMYIDPQKKFSRIVCEQLLLTYTLKMRNIKQGVNDMMTSILYRKEGRMFFGTKGNIGNESIYSNWSVIGQTKLLRSTMKDTIKRYYPDLLSRKEYFEARSREFFGKHIPGTIEEYYNNVPFYDS